MDKVRRIIDEALAIQEAEALAARLGAVAIRPAGGGAPVTLSQIADLGSRLWLSNVPPGMQAAGAIQAAIDSLSLSGGGLLSLEGRIFDVERTIHVRPGVTLDGGWGGFRAAEAFQGSEVVRTENSTLDYTAAGYAKATNISNLVVDCAKRRGVRGLVQSKVQKDRVSGLRIRACLDDGWIVEGGYELFGTNFEIIAASRRDGGITPADGRRGLVCNASDCHFSDGVAQHFPVGIHSPGAHNQFARLHAWSTYYAEDPPMLIGFLDEGEGNTFTACSADSPRLADLRERPSRRNGGYGFYGDGHSINRRLLGCTVQLSQYGDAAALPPPGRIVAVYCGQVRNTILALEVRDYGSAGFGKVVEAESAAVLRETTILGGNVHEGMPTNLYLPGLDTAPFEPRLLIGGRDSAEYMLRYGFAKRIGGMTFFEMHIRLARKGRGTGSVSLAGLPDASLSWAPGRRTTFGVALSGWANREAVIAVLPDGSSALHLVKQFSSESATEKDLTDATEISVAGQYVTHTLAGG